jgi:hypothetical protein
MLRTIVIGTVGAAVVGGTGAGALALSDSPVASTPASSSSATGAHAHPRLWRAIAKRAVHGSVVLRDRDGHFVTVDFGRGTVTSVSATSLSVKTADGTPLTFTLDSGTKYRERSNGKGTAGSASDITSGDTVVVFGRAAGGSSAPVAKRVIELG